MNTLSTISHKVVPLPTLIFLGLNFSALAAIDYTYSLTEHTIRLDTVESPFGQKFLRISGEDLLSKGNPGEPEIPYAVVRFLVPDNAYDFTVKISDLNSLPIVTPEICLYPVQKEVSMKDFTNDMFTEPDKNAYEEYFSEFKAEVIEDSRLEGRFHVITIALRPISYNGETNSLKICQNMNIRLEYKESMAKSKESETKNKPGIINIGDIVVNPPILENGMQKAAESILQPAPSRYYIISDKSLLPALDNLASWKMQKGYNVTVKAIEDIYDDPKYKVNEKTGIVDEAASLRKYLQDEEIENGCFFCLLVGDHKTNMPIRKVRNSYSTNVNGDSYIPTDNYFSDLSENNWNHIWDQNGIYVCSVSSVYSPDIYVGRLLCHTEEQIRNYTSKLILYESNPGRGNADYLEDTAIAVQHDGYRFKIGGEPSYKLILDKMESTFASVDCVLDVAIKDDNASGSPTGVQVLEVLNNSGYCSLVGHGEPSTIACSGKHTPSSGWEYIKALNSYSYNEDKSLRQTNLSRPCKNNGLDLLTNFDSPSIIYTLACTTCPFDIYKSSLTFDLPHTMASSYTVGGLYGGVAYLGNTREGGFQRSPPLEVSFLDILKQNPRIGVAEAISKYMYTRHNEIRHTHNLIGDPEFEMWLQEPSLFNLKLWWQSDCISFNRLVQSGWKIVVDDGKGNIKVYDDFVALQKVPYIDDSDKMVSIGFFKSGFLPIVKLDCYDQHLTNCYKRFVVREASFGKSDMSTSVTIGDDAFVSVRTVDKAECGNGLTVAYGGILSIESDKDVDIEGSIIESGGEVTIIGKTINIKKGFSTERGGLLTINNKR